MIAGAPRLYAHGDLMIVRLFTYLGRRASPILAASLFVGIAFPDLSRLMKPLFGVALVTLMICAALRIDWRAVRNHLQPPQLPALMLAWMLVGAPLLTAGVIAILGPMPSLGAAIVLSTTCPVLVAVPAFALLLRLDGALALVLMIASHLLLPLVQPPLVLWLLGIELGIDAMTLITRLILLVGGCFGAAALIRWLGGRERIDAARWTIDGLAILSLVVFCIGVMDGFTLAFLSDPGRVALFVIGAIVVNFGLQAAGGLAFAWAPVAPGLIAALASGNRNLGLLIPVLGEAADADLLLFIACGQFPIYLVPAVLGPLYRRLRERPS